MMIRPLWLLLSHSDLGRGSVSSGCSIRCCAAYGFSMQNRNNHIVGAVHPLQTFAFANSAMTAFPPGRHGRDLATCRSDTDMTSSSCVHDGRPCSQVFRIDYSAAATKNRSSQLVKHSCTEFGNRSRTPGGIIKVRNVSTTGGQDIHFKAIIDQEKGSMTQKILLVTS